MIWLQSFADWPAPAGPKCVIRLPIAASAGRARTSASSSPPTIIVNVPSIAPFSPPETGASSQNRPFDLASSASSRVTCGEIVLISMMIAPGFAEANMPSSPRATDTTSGESVTIVTMISLAAATSAGVLAACALPSEEFSATNFAALPGVRVATVKLNPALSRLRAIGAPMIPRPIRPTFMIFSPRKVVGQTGSLPYTRAANFIVSGRRYTRCHTPKHYIKRVIVVESRAAILESHVQDENRGLKQGGKALSAQRRGSNATPSI